MGHGNHLGLFHVGSQRCPWGGWGCPGRPLGDSHNGDPIHAAVGPGSGASACSTERGAGTRAGSLPGSPLSCTSHGRQGAALWEYLTATVVPSPGWRGTAAPCGGVSSAGGKRGARGAAAGLGGTSGGGEGCVVSPSAFPACGGTGAESRRYPPLTLPGGSARRMGGLGLAGISVETQVLDRVEQLKPSALPLLISSTGGVCFAMTSLQMRSFYSSRSHL